MKAIVFMAARGFLRGVLPYPDLPRRVRVRRRARAVATRDPWPRDDALVTADGYARLALLRLLALQRATRRAVQTHQRESAALLARTAMETCILGLWCLHSPDAVRKLRESEIKIAPNLLTFMSSAGLVPDQVIRQAVRALGEPSPLLPVRSMTEQIDSKTGATLAIHLYDMAYRPASHYFTHANSSALLRHVTTTYRYRAKPSNPWVRRAPVRLTDACVGLLASAVATNVAEPADLFTRYAESHGQRVLPPMLVTIGRAMTQRISVSGFLAMWKEAREVHDYLSLFRLGDVPDDREVRLRAFYEASIARLQVDDLPEAAIEPVIDYFVTRVIAEWDAEHQEKDPEPGHTH